jgi:CMP-N-acetylneuraminic acid synthetase
MEKIKEKKSLTGDKIYGYMMKEDEIDDIDTEADFEKSKNRKKE